MTPLPYGPAPLTTASCPQHTIYIHHSLPLALHSQSFPHIQPVEECTLIGTDDCFTHFCLPHPLKHRTHILRTPNSHDHPHPRVHSSPPLPTHTPDPPSRKKRNNTVRALLGNGGPVTRSHPPPPNPCYPDPPPNPPQSHSNSLKTPRTTPLPQSPGASIAHLRNHDRTAPLARPHPLAMTPTMTRRPTPIPHTQTLILPQHTINTVDKPPTTPSTTPSLVRSINNTATTRRSTPRLPAQSG